MAGTVQKQFGEGWRVLIVEPCDPCIVPEIEICMASGRGWERIRLNEGQVSDLICTLRDAMQKTHSLKEVEALKSEILEGATPGKLALLENRFAATIEGVRSEIAAIKYKADTYVLPLESRIAALECKIENALAEMRTALCPMQESK